MALHLLNLQAILISLSTRVSKREQTTGLPSQESIQVYREFDKRITSTLLWVLLWSQHHSRHHTHHAHLLPWTAQSVHMQRLQFDGDGFKKTLSQVHCLERSQTSMVKTCENSAHCKCRKLHNKTYLQSRERNR